MIRTLNLQDELTRVVEQSCEVKRRMLQECGAEIERIGDAFVGALGGGHKALLCGNGGSAADAQHIAGEFVGRFLMERRPLAAIALTADSSVSTCISNDYSFQDIFARQVEALAQPGDLVVGITTSGNSENVLRAIAAAKDKGALTIGFTGQKGGKLKEMTDLCLCVPSETTARIQEAHITVWHVICGYVDNALFGQK